MKNQEIKKILRFKGLAFRYGLYILSSILVIFLGAFIYTFTFSYRILLEDARNDASNITELAISKIRNTLQPVEEVPNLLAKKLEYTDDITAMLKTIREFIAENKEVYGSCIAYEPYQFKAGEYYYAPYQYEKDGRVLFKMLGGDQYDYLLQDWYRLPKMLAKGVWSEPYFDRGGGDMYMCTYAVPFYKIRSGERRFAGVVTMDISLASLRTLVDTIHVFKSGFSFLISGKGTIIAFRDSRMIHGDIHELAKNNTDTNVHRAVERMMSGQSGFIRLRSVLEDKPSWMYYAPVTGTGWSFGLVFPSTELLSSFIDFSWRLLGIFVASVFAILIVIILITRKFTRPIQRLVSVTHRIGQGDFNVPLPVYKAKDEIMQLSNSFSLMQEELHLYIDRLKETTSANEKMQSELNVARTIQMGLLPEKFPDRNDCEVAALLIPAKTIGGDLYDYLILEENTLYLAIGDVSGKGVPGALFMAIARTLFRSRIGKDVALDSIMENMNLELCRENPNQIFVTFLVARIDLANGRMEICNAGHTQPFIRRNAGRIEKITQLGGIPLGIFDNISYSSGAETLKPGDTLVLITDGITEAANKEYDLYGESGLVNFLGKPDMAGFSGITQQLVADVRGFTLDAEQSDDIAILVMNYRGRMNPANERVTEPGSRNFVIRNHIPELKRLAEEMDKLAMEWNLPPKTATQVQLVLEELISNIIFYAYDDPREHEIHIDLTRSAGGIQIMVEDDGKPFDILKHEDIPDVMVPAEKRKIGGLGIHFTREIMDDIRYERKANKNRVILVKKY